MDWKIHRRISDIKDNLCHCHNSTAYFLDCVNLCAAQMEEQRISARGKGVCGSRHWKAKIQEERQGSLLWQKNAAQSKINQWPSTCYWARKEEASGHEICSSIITT